MIKIILLLSIFIPCNLFAVTFSTKTIKQSGGDYSSLKAWDAGEEANLVSLDRVAVAEIDGVWTSSETYGLGVAGFSLNGWNTDATHYIRIYTTPSARHSGVWDNAKYRINSYYGSVYIQQNHVKMDGLQIDFDDNPSTGDGFLYGINLNGKPGDSNLADIEISNNIIRYNSATTPNWGDAGVSFQPNSTGTFKVYNNIIYNWSYGIEFTTKNVTSKGNVFVIYNNTLYNSNRYTGGDRAAIQITTSSLAGVNDLSVYLKNNLVQGPGKGYNIYPSITQTTSNNISNDSSSPDAAFRNITVPFSSIASSNFHLVETSTDAVNKGADLTSDTQLPFNLDFQFQHRRSAEWDIGADERITVGQNKNQVLGQ